MNQVSHFQHFTRSEGSGWDFISPIGLTRIPIRFFVFSDYQHVNGTRSYLFTVSPHLIPIHSVKKVKAKLTENPDFEKLVPI